MLQVGQKIYWVPNKRNQMVEQEVTVEKVGKKWATISGGRYRIDIETLRADGGNYSSPGCCYLDRMAYDAELEASRTWDKFRQSIGFHPLKGVTATDIQQAMILLKISQRSEG